MTSGRPLMLKQARLIGATITVAGAGILARDAVARSLRDVRAGYLGGGAAVGSVLVAGSLVMLSLGAFLPIALAPLPAAAGFAWGITRQFRPIVERTQLGLEVALDHLERGSAKAAHQLPPRTVNLLDQLAGELSARARAPQALLKP